MAGGASIVKIVHIAGTLELKDVANKLAGLDAFLGDSARLFGLEAKRASLREKEAQSGADGFWDDTQKAQAQLKEINDLKKSVDMLDGIGREMEDFRVHFKLARDAGEQAAIKVKLFKDGWWFFDSNKGEKTFTVNTAGSYELAFTEKDLTKNKDLMDDGSEKGATKYFVKWGFKRIGKVSTDACVDKGRTPKIPL